MIRFIDQRVYSGMSVFMRVSLLIVRRARRFIWRLIQTARSGFAINLSRGASFYLHSLKSLEIDEGIEMKLALLAHKNHQENLIALVYELRNLARFHCRRRRPHVIAVIVAAIVIIVIITIIIRGSVFCSRIALRARRSDGS